MQTLLQTNDPVLLSYAQSLLGDAGIECTIFDTNISVLEGSIGVFPRRLIVATGDFPSARRVLWEAGLAGELEPVTP